MNLLPQSEQTKIKHEYRVRFLAVCAYAGAAVCVAGVVSLLPSYVSLLAQENALESQFAELKNEETSEEDTRALADLDALKKEIALLKKNTSAQTPTSLISIVVEKKDAARAASGSGLRVESVIYDTTNDGGKTLSVSGTAGTRGALREFVKALETEYAFSSVKVPVSNFVKDRDVPFTIAISVKKQEEAPVRGE